ncbi:hypothetical protein D3C84_1266870 [compost metagenome]
MTAVVTPLVTVERVLTVAHTGAIRTHAGICERLRDGHTGETEPVEAMRWSLPNFLYFLVKVP